MKSKYVKPALLGGLFLVFTLLVKIIDVQEIGPLGSKVGFAALNGAFADLIGQSEFWYTVSKVLGLLAFPVIGLFGLVGFLQLVTRKKLLKVDKEILTLGCLYLLTGALYLMFGKVVVNFRPVLEEGALEASYPSSHTVLALVVYVSAAWMIAGNPRISDKASKTCSTVLYSLCAVLVLSRLLCGVHWLTDIIGGLVLSAFLLVLFETVLESFEDSGHAE